MMLPSGNDAAQALAIYFGSIIKSNGESDPNDAVLVTKEAIEYKMKQRSIRLAYDY